MEEKLAIYQAHIKNILNEYGKLKTENSAVELIFDDERKRYLAIWIGWYKHKRIHQCAIHIDINEQGQIVIQCNDTEELLDQQLIELGVPKEDIYLGMIPAEYQDEAA